MQATISPQEKALIEQRPTNDLAAYDLYLQAKELIDSYTNAPDPKVSFLKAIRLLDEATARDPGFVLAYCYAARAHDLLYFLRSRSDPGARGCGGRSRPRRRCASRPIPPKPISPWRIITFVAERDYGRADKELALARPGDAEQHRFSHSLRIPPSARRQMGGGETRFRPRGRSGSAQYQRQQPARRYLRSPATVRQGDCGRRPNASPPGSISRSRDLRREFVRFAATGDPEILRRALAQAPADIDVGGGETPVRILVALVRQDYAEAARVLAASPRDTFQEVDFSFYYPRAWYEAIIARAAGDKEKARAAFAAARKILEQRLTIKPDDARTIAVLAQVDAGLGQKEQAIAEGRHAVELMPLSRDAYDGMLVLQGLAQVYTWTGETEKALELVRQLMKIPGYLTYGYLKVDPSWDPLRSDPRFQEFVASLAPHK